MEIGNKPKALAAFEEALKHEPDHWVSGGQLKLFMKKPQKTMYFRVVSFCSQFLSHQRILTGLQGGSLTLQSCTKNNHFVKGWSLSFVLIFLRAC